MIWLVCITGPLCLCLSFASGDDVAPLLSSEETSVTIYQGKKAVVDSFAKKSSATLTHCAMLCVSQRQCYFANAIFNDTYNIECHMLGKAVTSEELISSSNTTFIMLAIFMGCFDPRLSNQNSVAKIRYPNESTGDVYCDQETDGGGWMVFQRRVNGIVNFYRDWKSYKEGFGDIKGDFWLGLDKIHDLVSNGNYTLRIDLWSEDASYYAKYSEFTISDETDGYRINWHTFEGNGGDSMDHQRLMKFSTFDRDNDYANYNCANAFHGAWWYRDCHHSNLNGLYGSTAFGKGLNWMTAKGHAYSFARTEMKIKKQV